MRTITELRRAAVSSVDAFKRKAGMTTFAEVSSPGGGGGVTFDQGVITGYGDGNKTFKVRRVDANGAPSGEEFDVYAKSLPRIGGLMGQQDLTNCDPQPIVGDPIEFSQRILWVGGSTFIDDYWALDTFMLYGC